MTLSVSPELDEESANNGNLTEEFRLLSSKRRQQVIWCMARVDPDETLTARELAKQIVAEEEGIPVAEVANEKYRPVYSNLTQHHLPKLAQANVIKYDSSRKEITPGPNVMALAVTMAMVIPTIPLLLGTDLVT